MGDRKNYAAGQWRQPGAEVAKQNLQLPASADSRRWDAPAMAAAVRYQAMNSVPENWIPFIPVHLPNNNREIQLQRAAMPRILVGDPNPAQKVQPLTSLLRQGLDPYNSTALFPARRRGSTSWRPPHAVLLT